MIVSLFTEFARRLTDWRTLLKIAGTGASGLMLAASFPGLFGAEPGGWYAWAALAPLILVASHAAPRRAFMWGMAAGTLFWLIGISWLLKLTGTSPTPWPWIVLGWVFLACYSALYTGAFAMVASFWIRAWGTANILRNTVMTFGFAAVWVGFEYLRGLLFTGYPWNPLGVSQYRNIAVIQVAEWWGVYGVSAMIALINAGIAIAINKHLNHEPGTRRYRPHPEIYLAAILVLVAVCQFGPLRARRYTSQVTNLRVAVVQPAIPQDQKWEDEDATRRHIVDRLRDLSRIGLAAEERPDLLVWPETSTPDCLRDTNGVTRAMVAELMTNGVPLLAGSLDYEHVGGRYRYYNSAILIDGSNHIVTTYAKQHLVPVGEYIPLAGIFPILDRLAPFGWTCSAGTTPTVFTIRHGVDGAVLICFEDAFPGLARQFVRRGARLLINMTNDAWFDISEGSRQHLAHFVFRCVENRVAGVRAANTGISCFIDRNGQVYETLAAGPGGAPLAGTLNSGVFVPAAGAEPLTFYTRHGDRYFALPCAIFALTMLVLAAVKTRPGVGTTGQAANDGGWHV